jgi:hypothetical protein
MTVSHDVDAIGVDMPERLPLPGCRTVWVGRETCGPVSTYGLNGARLVVADMMVTE